MRVDIINKDNNKEGLIKKKRDDRGHRKAKEGGGSATVITRASHSKCQSSNTQIFSFAKWRKWK